MKRFLTVFISLTIAFSSICANELKPFPVPDGFGADGHFTVMTWVYIPSELGKINMGGFGVSGFAFVSRGMHQDGVQFYLGEVQGIPEFKFCNVKGGWKGIVRSGDMLAAGSKIITRSELPELQADKWFHIAGVRDGDTMSLYIDGNLVATVSGLPVQPQVTGPASLCALRSRPALIANRFPGYLEKTVLEERAFSAGEIRKAAEDRSLLKEKMPSIRTAPKPDMTVKLPIYEKWEKTYRVAKNNDKNCVAKVVRVDGRPRLMINGKVVDGTLAIPKVEAKLSDKTATLRDFAAAGVRIYSDVIYSFTRLNDWWLDEGEYDFPALELRLNAMIKACPDGYILPRFKLDPPEWWREQNPDEMYMGFVKPDSKKWHALFERMLRDVIGHLEKTKLAKHIIGYNYGALVGSEWIWRRNDFPKDYNPQYWKERADAISEPALLAARVIKEITGGNKLTGVFFGYRLSEHANLMQLVESPDIDFFCSPISYNGRRAGEPGRFSSYFQGTYRLHNKLYWNEADERTEFSEYTGLWHPAWHQLDGDETQAAMERDLGWALTSGHEIWWFAIAGNEVFHDERIMQTVKRGVELCENRPAKPRVSEVAVFTPVWYAPDPAEARPKDLTTQFLNFVVSTCGVPFDSYELSDLANPNLPKYKAAIVLTSTHGQMPSPVDKDMKLTVITNEKDLPKTAEELRKWCVDNGARVWNDSGDVFGAGCGFAFIHTVTSGEKVINLPGGKVWKEYLEPCQTRIIKY